jgi:hypothetical protein
MVDQIRRTMDAITLGDHMTQRTTPIDLIWGCREIAHVIAQTTDQTYRLLEQGALPARRVGHRWVARRSALEGFFPIATVPTSGGMMR